MRDRRRALFLATWVCAGLVAAPSLGAAPLLRELTGHKSAVLCLAFSPDGRKILSGGKDMTVKLWDAARGNVIASWRGHTASVRAVAFSPDGSNAVSASLDKTLRLWDVPEGRELSTWIGHREAVTGVVFSPDGTKALSSSWDRTLSLWNVRAGTRLATWTGHSWAVYSVAFLPDGKTALSGSQANTLFQWDAATGKILARWRGGPTRGKTAEEASGRLGAVKRVVVFTALRVAGHADNVLSIALSPQGRVAISAGEDGAIRLWRVDRGEVLKTWQAHSGHVNSVALSPDAEVAASGGDDGAVRIWDVRAGRAVAVWKEHGGPVHAVAFSPDGRALASAGDDGTIRLWSVPAERPAEPLLSGKTEGQTERPAARPAHGDSGDAGRLFAEFDRQPAQAPAQAVEAGRPVAAQTPEPRMEEPPPAGRTPETAVAAVPSALPLSPPQTRVPHPGRKDESIRAAAPPRVLANAGRPAPLSSAPPAAPQRARRQGFPTLLWAGIAACVVALVAGLAIRLRRSDSRRPPASEELSASRSADAIGAGVQPQVASASLLAAEPAAAVLIGGKYELRALLGEGGMGLVYEGYDPHLERKVAIKKMRPEIRSAPRVRQHFIGEARRIAKTHHPYIVNIIDIIHEGGEIYLIMDFVEGQTLAAHLDERQRLPLTECKELFRYVCEAVDFAHRQNVLHRDLKPANVMINKEGFAILMDFGLAREAKDTVCRLTNRETSGSPAYMAPEQHLGQASRSSDIYSLGVMLYETATGELPFRGPDFLVQKERLVYAPPSKVVEGLSTRLDDLLAAALHPDPRNRLESAIAFYERLRAA